MDLLKTQFSFNSTRYLKLVASRVLAMEKETENVGETPSEECSGVDSNPKLCFCTCKVCRDRRKTSLTNDTVYYVEFQLHALKVDDKELTSKLIARCREENVHGYIIYSYEHEDAMGIMEGSIKSINEINSWLHTLTEHIPEPMAENIYFSWFLVCRRPSKLEFDERITPPHYITQLVDRSSEYASSD